VSCDGEFRFPPTLKPTTMQELKFVTLWELWGEPPIHEIFGDARHLQRADKAACAERVIRELLNEGYASLLQTPWDDPDAPAQQLTPAEVEHAFHRLREFEAWREHSVCVRLAPTDKWWEWAEVAKGFQRPRAY